MSEPLYRKGDEVEVVRRGVIVEVDPRDPHRFGIGRPGGFGADAYFRTDDDTVRHSLVTMTETTETARLAALVLERRDEIKRLQAQIDAARDLHYEFKVYGDCGHHIHEDEHDTVELSNGGYVCRSAYEFSVCRDCCAPNDELSQDCQDDHDHRADGWRCATRMLLDGTTVQEVATCG